ncbi:hypothetical protein ACXR2U_04535 [Jatrophihabitans sp. YIM 134969]
MTRVPESAVRTAVAAYADRWHRGLPTAHQVTSPLGAWLVLALAAPLTSGRDRADVEAALGLPADEASVAAGALLDAAPEAVAAAAAFWCRPEVLDGWTPTWPEAVATGPVPDQAAADAWTREHTLGLLSRFPVELSPLTMFVLCSAIATRVRWRVPFQVGEPFGGWTVPTLTAAGGAAGAGMIVGSRIGDLAVWTASTDDGLDVTSVVADPAVPAADVLAVAHEVAVSVTTDPGHTPRRRSLFDLPLGATDRWELTEHVGPHPRSERVTARLPAWEAGSTHALLADPGTGFGAIGRALAARTGGPEVDAVQAALARFGREGFEAAAVTAVAGRAAASGREDGPQRHATLLFGHPYAVVATAGGWRQEDLHSPWFGMPVFAAWVSRASDPADVTTG